MPDPDGPFTATNSPRATSRVTSRKACVCTSSVTNSFPIPSRRIKGPASSASERTVVNAWSASPPPNSARSLLNMNALSHRLGSPTWHRRDRPGEPPSAQPEVVVPYVATTCETESSVLTLVPVTLFVGAVLAALGPAWRAARTDPVRRSAPSDCPSARPC